ncbi:tautomerase family protein [Rhodococcus koreensis]|uniref:tautomerase family protein n=1 Tax=Rhodococcus koreensis TaxID=99653 RepID=UPI00197E522A|nr:tautomerase family protein [Rhodococcus koreensis]QSE86390.1 tautomerase family protein [Rhodococcus koreensis]
MPLWQLFTPKNAFTSEEKSDLAQRISDIYSGPRAKGTLGFELPRFYTTVVFHEIDADSFFVGGKSHQKFVQVEVVHIARTNEGAAALMGISVEEILANYFGSVSEVLKPYIEDRGYEVEFHIETAPFETWKIDGMTPPPPESAAERRWFEENRSSPYDAKELNNDPRVATA